VKKAVVDGDKRMECYHSLGGKNLGLCLGRRIVRGQELDAG
jgi:hypothetical protein